MSQEKLNQLVQELNQLPALELSKLKKLLEEEWGVTAAAPMMMAAGSIATGSGTATEEAEEASEFLVTLEEYPADKKISVIKVIREVTGLGLKEAKDLVEAAPKPIKEEGISKADAEAIVKKLQDAGAKASLKGKTGN